MLDLLKRYYRSIHHELVVKQVQRKLNLENAPEPFEVPISATVSKLIEANIPLVYEVLDDQAVSQFAEQAEYEFYYPSYYSDRILVRLKKIREHYVSAILLGLNNSDIYLDIASQISPAPQVYERLFGCQVLRQDIEYPSGRHGRTIGCRGSKILLEDNSITKAAMHCSLEHFEGDEDIALLKEVERILVPGGIFVIVPIYLSDEYLIFTQPSLYAELPNNEWPKFDPKAKLYLGKSNRHERYYDADQLLTRIIKQTNMKVTIHSFGSDHMCNLGQMRFVAEFRKEN